MKFEENHLYQLIDKPGGFYMFAHNKLMKVETPDHALAWLFRAGQYWYKKKLAIAAADLEGVKVYDFKGKELK